MPRKVIPFPVRQIGGGGEPPKYFDDDTLRAHITYAVDALMLAGVVAVFGLFFLRTNEPSAPPLMGFYSTAKGQYGCWKLPDHSELCLDTDSAARYTFTGRARNIELLSGQVSVTVAKDPRPLEVLSGGLLTRDLSTQFNVSRTGSVSLMTVLSGGVKARAIDKETHQQFDLAQSESGWDVAEEFHQRQQVEFDESTGILRELPPLTADDLSQVTAWKRGQIVTNSKTLRQILEQFGRYQPIEDFIIPDRDLDQLRGIGGEVDGRELTRFLDSLEAVYGIHHETVRGTRGESIVYLWRTKSAGTHSPHK